MSSGFSRVKVKGEDLLPFFAGNKLFVMSTLPPCPKCQSVYAYESGDLLMCPECGHEWSAAEVAEDSGYGNGWCFCGERFQWNCFAKW